MSSSWYACRTCCCIGWWASPGTEHEPCWNKTDCLHKKRCAALRNRRARTYTNHIKHMMVPGDGCKCAHPAPGSSETSSCCSPRCRSSPSMRILLAREQPPLFPPQHDAALEISAKPPSPHQQAALAIPANPLSPQQQAAVTAVAILSEALWPAMQAGVKEDHLTPMPLTQTAKAFRLQRSAWEWAQESFPLHPYDPQC